MGHTAASLRNFQQGLGNRLDLLDRHIIILVEAQRKRDEHLAQMLTAHTNAVQRLSGELERDRERMQTLEVYSASLGRLTTALEGIETSNRLKNEAIILQFQTLLDEYHLKLDMVLRSNISAFDALRSTMYKLDEDLRSRLLDVLDTPDKRRLLAVMDTAA